MAEVGIRDIHKRFGRTEVLRGVSLDVADGEFVTLLGPSGCGKSTLLRVLAGLEPQDHGEIRIGGRPVDHLPPKARDVAMVFQSYALYPYLSVFDNMAMPLLMRRLTPWQRLPLLGRVLPGSGAARQEIARAVREVAAALGLEGLLDRKPHQLSGGQRQRVALGRAMVRQPQVFLMDEPLSNLDAKLRVQTRTEIADLHRRLGVTFLFVTHDQAEAMTMSDRVALMMEGRILQVASPQALYEDPDDLRVAEFVGSPRINLLPGAIRSDGGVALPGAVLPLRGSLNGASTVRVGLRPEAFRLANGQAAGALSAQLRFIEYLGAQAYLHLRIEGQSAPLVVRTEPQGLGGLRPGQAVAVRPLAERALFFDAEGRRLRPLLVGS